MLWLVSDWGNWTDCPGSCGPGWYQSRTELNVEAYPYSVNMTCNQFPCDGK